MCRYRYYAGKGQSTIANSYENMCILVAVRRARYSGCSVNLKQNTKNIFVP